MNLSKRTVIVLTTLAGVALVGLGVAQGAAELMAKPTAVALVDLQAVFDGATIREQFRADQLKWKEDFEAQREAKRKEIDNLQYELNALDRGSEQYKRQAEQLQLKAMEFNLWVRFQQDKANFEQGNQLFRLYSDLRTVVAQVAQEQGYDLVLYDDSPTDINWNQMNELQAQIQLRKVLYASDAIDITDQVLQRLNTMHSAG